jgi:hypothetical protein
VAAVKPGLERETVQSDAQAPPARLAGLGNQAVTRLVRGGPRLLQREVRIDGGRQRVAEDYYKSDDRQRAAEARALHYAKDYYPARVRYEESLRLHEDADDQRLMATIGPL